MQGIMPYAVRQPGFLKPAFCILLYAAPADVMCTALAPLEVYYTAEQHGMLLVLDFLATDCLAAAGFWM
jgi:hypothetical protein